MTATLDPSGRKQTPEATQGVEPEATARKSSPSGVQCREIRVEDLGAILDLLCEGFTRRPRRYWMAALEILGAREAPGGTPRYGYMLESAGRPVGVLLAIASATSSDGTTKIRSNSSAWYVRPGFRFYAHILQMHWLRSPADTYLNVSPAKNTLPIIEAQGFARFTNGIFLSIPSVGLPSNRIRILDGDRFAEAERPIPDDDLKLLGDHFRAGCIALWCETPKGGRPFVFRRRLVRSLLPCAQLIYCRDLEDLTRLAAPLGRHLLSRGLPFLLAATNGPIRGMPGVYIGDSHPMYFRGETKPAPNDLAYTEAALFGF
jgi:hypothetical protein